MDIRKWLRLWFSFRERVGRREYIVSGLLLVVLKYLGSVAIAWPQIHRVWSPLEYLGSLHAMWAIGQAAWSPTFLFVYALWTLPFLWIGVSMTMRRALDADR